MGAFASSNAMTHTLLICHDVAGKYSAGPGLRYSHLARVLSSHTDLTFAIPGDSDGELDLPNTRITRYERRHWRSIKDEASRADTIVLPSDIAADFPQLADLPACLVIDGYDPLMAEWLSLTDADTRLDEPTKQRLWQQRLVELSLQYAIGDFYICASERQRDWWLGLLEANGRVNLYTHRSDSSYRNLIDVVAFGLPEESPRHTRAVIKGVWHNIAPDSRVLLWGGGLWTWLDPIGAIRAVEKLSTQRKDIRLVFPGTRHPNQMLHDIPTRIEEAKSLADSLGMTDRFVFFGDWISSDDWQNVLLESDVALSLHFDTLETRLAYRSRILHYIWAGIPIVATEGDATSELVAAFNIGAVVKERDIDGIAQAISLLLDTSHTSFENGFARAREMFTWTRVAKPLIDFCKNPRRAADRRLGMTTQIDPEILALRAEVNRLRQQVLAYERGKFIKIMKWLKSQ
jgi:glycosyltransferase involved in cell wall biosynthesis